MPNRRFVRMFDRDLTIFRMNGKGLQRDASRMGAARPGSSSFVHGANKDRPGGIGGAGRLPTSGDGIEQDAAVFRTGLESISVR